MELLYLSNVHDIIFQGITPEFVDIYKDRHSLKHGQSFTSVSAHISDQASRLLNFFHAHIN